MTPPREPAEPHISNPHLIDVPAALKCADQWVTWRSERRRAEATKVPYDARTLQPAKVNDPRTWCSFAEALARYADGGVSGIGFVFAPQDPFVGIDLDACRDPATGTVADWAAEIVRRLDSYTEVSPSRRGLKVFVRGTLPCRASGRRQPLPAPRKPNGQQPQLELYHHSRFFAVTGMRLPAAPAEVRTRQAAIDALWERWFARCPKAGRDVHAAVASHIAKRFTDDGLLRLARHASNGGQFRQLFDEGRIDLYGHDHSRADYALCCMLAFWTGGDVRRIDRLFRGSALLRSKWDARHAADGSTYGAMTIRAALNHVYRPDGD